MNRCVDRLEADDKDDKDCWLQHTALCRRTESNATFLPLQMPQEGRVRCYA